MTTTPEELTELLKAWSAGDEDAFERLVFGPEVGDGELWIGLAPVIDLRLDDPLEIVYRVSVEELDRLEVSGTVEVVARGIHARESMSGTVTGAAAVRYLGAPSVSVAGCVQPQ